ncbi:superoxide dismutase [Natronorubrum texcoconense]|uniref:superoxide dismutase n=1 Tax=Natronorubrum texcoconense TaxID=1095776 RepID=A0A1G8ZNY0_9EURY|nr:superoxide dismutase [Natronorubrum texcoconense]SDK16809.1 superoxide dismutase, Fe-Mn family [Natronorubrum texcoconense]
MSNKLLGSSPRRRQLLQTLGGAAGVALLGTGATTVAADEHDADTGDGQRARYRLPELPYEYDALEPHIDERIMELHHSEHHQAYVDGANEALDEFETMRETGEFDGIRAAKRDYSFNLSGHVNHTIFWENMSPDGGGEPDGDLAATIDEQFGSFTNFQDEFTATANAVEGDGWAMLFYEPLVDALVIGQVEGQNELAHQRAIPILALDVWEHAYYLQYENDREAYVEEWWNVVDWADVSRRYEVLTGARGADEETESEDGPSEPAADEGGLPDDEAEPTPEADDGPTDLEHGDAEGT